MVLTIIKLIDNKIIIATIMITVIILQCKRIIRLMILKTITFLKNLPYQVILISVY